MVYTKNTSRKKDFEIISKILDYNEYYEKIIKVTYDKNFFFYKINVQMKNEKENPRDLRSIGVSVAKNLYDAGFIIQEFYLSTIDRSGIVTGWGGLSDSVKVKDIATRYSLILVKESELQKYFRRGSFY